MKKIEEAEVKGKKVLVRACFDVPVKAGKVVDDSRLRAAVPTVKYLLESGAAVILISKMGRPEGKVVKELSLSQVVEPLSDLLGRSVKFVGDCVGTEAQSAVSALVSGEVLLLENLRFHKEEEENDAEFAKSLASYADLFVMDDFPNVKNDHAGVTGVAKILPSYAGLDFYREVSTLKSIFENPAKPFVAVIGGAKISTKIEVLKALIKKIDVLIIGGAMANTFLVSEGYEVGKSLYEEDYLDAAEEITREAEDAGVELFIPDDVVAASKVAEGVKGKEKALDEITKSDIIVDIGHRSIAHWSEPLKFAGTIFWNGPIGIAEYKNFAGGTKALANIIASSRAKSIIGGGDTVAAVEEVKLKFDFVSNGGGATLELLAGEKLPGLEVLEV